MKLEDAKQYQTVETATADVDSDDSAKPRNNNLSDPTPNQTTTAPSNENMASCGRLEFPFTFACSLVQFVIFLNKIYQDSAVVAHYYKGNNLKLLLVSVLSLVAPVILYVVFLVSARVAKPGMIRCRDWGTNFIHGLLLIPWQIRGRAEVLHFTSQRICDNRHPTEDETESMATLNRHANFLEFFESFYASMIQLVLQLYVLLNNINDKKDTMHFIIMITSSILPLLTVIQAVRRRDDGPLTVVLSTIGWTAFFASRTVALALGSYVIHEWIVVICFLHVLLVSAWITRVAWKAHGELTPRRKVSVALLVTTLFGIPSLAYWPIMFQMKEGKRPLAFFLICVLENSGLFLLWFLMRPDWKIHLIHEKVMVGILLAGMLVGILFLSFYIWCKPKYTDEVVMYNMKVDNANSYGIFFDFCDATFPLPKTDRIEAGLERIRLAENTRRGL